jgi:DNA-binding transcriptional regulator YdaS (Cro superfamily)
MNFNTYLRESGRSASEFSASVGIHCSYVSHLRAGRRFPSLRVASLISEATGGMVSYADWEEHRLANEDR